MHAHTLNASRQGQHTSALFVVKRVWFPVLFNVRCVCVLAWFLQADAVCRCMREDCPQTGPQGAVEDSDEQPGEDHCPASGQRHLCKLDHKMSLKWFVVEVADIWNWGVQKMNHGKGCSAKAMLIVYLCFSGSADPLGCQRTGSAFQTEGTDIYSVWYQKEFIRWCFTSPDLERLTTILCI